MVAVAQLALAARRQAVALAAGATRVALQARAARGGERAVERGAPPAQAPPRAIVIVHFEHPDLVKERFPRSNAALIAAAQRAPGEWTPVCDHEP